MVYQPRNISPYLITAKTSQTPARTLPGQALREGVDGRGGLPKGGGPGEEEQGQKKHLHRKFFEGTVCDIILDVNLYQKVYVHLV